MRKPLFGAVVEPCTYGWENMEGTDKVRFCKECKLNVYNVADMTEEEVGTLLDSKSERTCVRLRQRSDGTVYTDNCPYKLRKLRNMLRRCAPVLLVLFAWAISQSAADAQGLVGAPVCVRYGQPNEVGQLADYGYDTARDCSRLATAASLFLSVPLGIWRLNRLRVMSLKLMLDHGVSLHRIRVFLSKRRWQAIALIILIPLGIHLIGTYLINNFGGLGAGL
jgi:hypothetical protein